MEYLNLFDKPWGIFTDGATWRLYRNEIISDGEKFFEFDFSELYNLYRTSSVEAKNEQGEFFEIAKYFYWFFSYESLIVSKPVVPLIEIIYQKSQGYVERIKEDLKEKYVHAMTIACNGYLRDVRKKNKNVDLKLVAKTAESFIFNLIFVRSCESKRIFPIEPAYLSISLKTLVDKVRHYTLDGSTSDLVKQSLGDFFKCKITEDGREIYNHLKNLFSTIEDGNHSLKLSGFLETVFFPEEKKMYQTYAISNKEMIRIIFLLFYDLIDERKTQVPYSVITPRQLGSPPKKKNKQGDYKKDCTCGAVIDLKQKIVDMIIDQKTSNSAPVLAGPDVKPGSFKVRRWIKLGLKGINYKVDLSKKEKKIYIVKNSDRIVAAYDQHGGNFLIMTLYACIPLRKTLPHNAIVSILNSKLIRFYYECTVNNGGTMTNSVMISSLESLPIMLEGISSDSVLSDLDVFDLYGLSKAQAKQVEKFVDKLNKVKELDMVKYRRSCSVSR